MIGAKVIRKDRPEYVNRRMHDAQRRAYRKMQRTGIDIDLLDAREVGEVLKMSRSAVHIMIANGEFPQATHRKGTRNAWAEYVVYEWLALGESHG